MVVDRFASGAPGEEPLSYSRAVRAGPWVLVGGTAPVDENGVVPAPGDAYGQALYVLEIVQATLERAGARLDQVVQTRVYVTDMGRAEEVGRAHGDHFGDIRPVTSMVEVGALIDPRMLVQIEAAAYLG